MSKNDRPRKAEQIRLVTPGLCKMLLGTLNKVMEALETVGLEVAGLTLTVARCQKMVRTIQYGPVAHAARPAPARPAKRKPPKRPSKRQPPPGDPPR